MLAVAKVGFPPGARLIEKMSPKVHSAARAVSLSICPSLFPVGPQDGPGLLMDERKTEA